MTSFDADRVKAVLTDDRGNKKTTPDVPRWLNKDFLPYGMWEQIRQARAELAPIRTAIDVWIVRWGSLFIDYDAATVDAPDDFDAWTGFQELHSEASVLGDSLIGFCDEPAGPKGSREERIRAAVDRVGEAANTD
jgi:hypothetical protein